MPQYFSHDVNAQRDDKCVRLTQALGWKGYGVYWALIERLNERDDCALEYNPKGLAWSLHISEKILVRVITEFDLFEISEDGAKFWSNSARRRKALRTAKYQKKSEKTPAKAKGKPGRPKKVAEAIVAPVEDPIEKPVETVVSSVETAPELPAIQEPEQNAPKTPQIEPESEARVNYQPEAEDNGKSALNPLNEPDSKKEPEPKAKPTVETISISPNPDPIPAPIASPQVYVPSEKIIALWNGIFAKTKQEYRGFYLDQFSHQRARETLSQGYDLDDLEKAFRVAKTDNFCWLLKDVLKPDNIQRLLIKGEKKNDLKPKPSGFNSGSYPAPADLPDDDWGNPELWEQYAESPDCVGV